MTTLRRATLGDESRIAGLAMMVHDLHVEHRPDQFGNTSAESLAGWYRKRLDEPTTLTWIAESDGTAVGYVQAVFHEQAEGPFTRARKWCEIDQLAVAPSHRRQGVARALVQAATREAHANGFSQVEAMSWGFNRSAQEVLQRLGFTPKAIRFECRSEL